MPKNNSSTDSQTKLDSENAARQTPEAKLVDVRKPDISKPKADEVKVDGTRRQMQQQVQLGPPVTSEAKDKGARLKSVLTSRVLLLGAGNLIFMFLLAFFLVKLPGKANELKRLRNASFRASSEGRTEIAKFEIESVRERADKLANLFPDESGLVDFVNDIEKIKEEGVVTRLSFASTEVVRDRTGYYGIPVIIHFRGSWSQIDTDLQKIQKLHFLFRAVSIKAEVFSEEENVVELSYGGFLYVDDKLGKD